MSKSKYHLEIESHDYRGLTPEEAIGRFLAVIGEEGLGISVMSDRDGRTVLFLGNGVDRMDVERGTLHFLGVEEAAALRGLLAKTAEGAFN